MNRPKPILKLLFSSLSIFLLLAGCGLLGEDARVIPFKGNNTKQQAKNQTSDNQVPQNAPPGYHIVRRGENLFAIARSYGAPVRSVISANRLEPPYKLHVGQRLRIPQAQKYVVQKGDTVYAISRRFNVAMNELVRVNGLQEPYAIKTGQLLLLPGEIAEKVVSSPQKTVAKSTTTKPPSPTAKTSSKPAPKKQVQTAYTKKGMPRPVPRPNRANTSRFKAAPGPISKPAPRASSKFLWPVRGQVISNYGPKGKGLQNDGLNIAAPRGTPVKASENGVVAYSGDELAGYGNLVLIKHADGFMTAYAHNGDILVKRGDKVSRGQTIARVGSSGNVDRPQLHFQVRKGKKILNPKKYLGG